MDLAWPGWACDSPCRHRVAGDRGAVLGELGSGGGASAAGYALLRFVARSWASSRRPANHTSVRPDVSTPGISRNDS